MNVSTRASDFVVTEHFIKKKGKTYFEKREAKVYTQGGKTRRIDVEITRMINQDKVVFVISKAGSRDSYIFEQTDLSPDTLEVFKQDWTSNWKPILPKDESLTPLMLTICTQEPMTFRSQNEDSKQDKDLKEKITQLECNAASECSRIDELANMLDEIEKDELNGESILVKEEPVIDGPANSADYEDQEERFKMLEAMMASMRVKIDQLEQRIELIKKK